MTSTLRVRNIAQKVLWENELSGQISDGQWENATPWDHWKPWCDATVVVDPEHPGRDFWARRESYNFSAKELLDVVGDRMLRYVQVATGDASYDMTRLRADLNDLKKIIKLHVTAAESIPPQPKQYKAMLMVDGYAQEYTTYVPTEHDPRAIVAIAKREEEQRAYRIAKLEKKREGIRNELANVEAELNRELETAGMLPLA